MGVRVREGLSGSIVVRRQLRELTRERVGRNGGMRAIREITSVCGLFEQK